MILSHSHMLFGATFAVALDISKAFISLNYSAMNSIPLYFHLQLPFRQISAVLESCFTPKPIKSGVLQCSSIFHCSLLFIAGAGFFWSLFYPQTATLVNYTCSCIATNGSPPSRYSQATSPPGCPPPASPWPRGSTPTVLLWPPGSLFWRSTTQVSTLKAFVVLGEGHSGHAQFMFTLMVWFWKKVQLCSFQVLATGRCLGCLYEWQ